jgi:hypothetical protein
MIFFKGYLIKKNLDVVVPKSFVLFFVGCLSIGFLLEHSFFLQFIGQLFHDHYLDIFLKLLYHMFKNML